MKVRPEHLAALRDAITPLDTMARRSVASQLKHSDMRYRWDSLWRITAATREPLLEALYSYADDSHIDTALRSIIPPLEKS